MVGFTENIWFGARHLIIILLTVSHALSINYKFTLGSLYTRSILKLHTEPGTFSVLNHTPTSILKIMFTTGRLLEVICTFITGVLTLKISNKYFLLVEHVINGVISFLLPLSLKTGYTKVFGCSICVFYLAQSLHWCSVLTILGKWIPPHEKCRSLTILYSLGFAMSLMLFEITDSIRQTTNFANSFYFTGTISILWVVFWFLFGAESPLECAFGSEIERRYLYKTLGYIRPFKNKTPIPWKSIIMCHSVYTISILLTVFTLSHRTMAFKSAHWQGVFAYKFSLSTTKVKKEVLPYFFLVPFFGIAMAYISDKMLNHWPVSRIRKFFSSIVCYGTGLTLAFVLYITSKQSITVFLLSEYFYATMYPCVLMTSLLDISTTYVGIVFSVASAPYAIFELALLFYPKLNETAQTIEALTAVFELNIFCVFVGNLIFCLGTYEKHPFDLVGTVPLKKQSIQSYPPVKL